MCLVDPKKRYRQQEKSGCLFLFLIYANNEPKSALAQDFGDCHDNSGNLRSVFSIVIIENL